MILQSLSIVRSCHLPFCGRTGDGPLFLCCKTRKIIRNKEVSQTVAKSWDLTLVAASGSVLSASQHFTASVTNLKTNDRHLDQVLMRDPLAETLGTVKETHRQLSPDCSWPPRRKLHGLMATVTGDLLLHDSA